MEAYGVSSVRMCLDHTDRIWRTKAFDFFVLSDVING